MIPPPPPPPPPPTPKKQTKSKSKLGGACWAISLMSAFKNVVKQFLLRLIKWRFMRRPKAWVIRMNWSEQKKLVGCFRSAISFFLFFFLFLKCTFVLSEKKEEERNCHLVPLNQPVLLLVHRCKSSCSQVLLLVAIQNYYSRLFFNLVSVN